MGIHVHQSLFRWFPTEIHGHVSSSDRFPSKPTVDLNKKIKIKNNNKKIIKKKTQMGVVKSTCALRNKRVVPVGPVKVRRFNSPDKVSSKERQRFWSMGLKSQPPLGFFFCPRSIIDKRRLPGHSSDSPSAGVWFPQRIQHVWRWTQLFPLLESDPSDLRFRQIVTSRSNIFGSFAPSGWHEAFNLGEPGPAGSQVPS